MRATLRPRIGRWTLTDDDEVALNLPRKCVEERDPPDEKIRDLPGATGSGAPVTRLSQKGTLVAIVLSNRWDDTMAALQLLSHLEGALWFAGPTGGLQETV